MNTIWYGRGRNLEPEVPMLIRSETNPSQDMYSADLEPFNGSREMLQTPEPFDERTSHGPSRVIFIAHVSRESIWTSTVKIALRRE